MNKLAIIGCGTIGKYHLNHFLTFTDIELVGFCDLIPERAEAFHEKAGRGAVFTDYKKMYDETSPDMVFICIPPYKHGEIEFETIKRRIHLFVEKPVTLDLDLAKQISAEIDKAGLISASGFQCRYDDGINEPVKDYIKNNPIAVAQCSRIGGVPGVDWWLKKSLSGGQLAEQTVHQVDILRYFLGELDTVYSVPRRGIITQEEHPGYDTDDVSTTLLTFKSGVTCTVITGCYSKNGASWDSKITLGARASRLDYELCSAATVYGVAKTDVAAEVEGTVKGDGTQKRSANEIGVKYRTDKQFGINCDRTFIDAVLGGDRTKIRSPYSDAIKTLEIVLACNKSMETGLPVKL